MKIERELMRGAAALAVLAVLQDGEMYGYELVKALSKRTDGVLALGQSTLYPMLYNLEAKGLVEARMDKAENGRPRKYYRLTGRGKTRLAADKSQWAALSAALGKLGVKPGGEPGAGLAGGGA
ncbi:MAG: helix-turn-helix transcriptional regulator [Planctomycetota bacterium]